MKHHVVTPFSRPENFTALLDMLLPFGVEWHLLLDEPTPFDLGPLPDWVNLYRFPKVEPNWMMWRRCVNGFVESGVVVPSDRYSILSDDSCYEPGFFEKVDAHPEEVVIASMKRGDQIPPGTPPERAHGTSTLEARPENMHPTQVSAEQIILSGRLFSRINLIVHPASDGYMIEAMVNDYPTGYEPEAFVLFNRLEKGRWK